MSKAEISKNGTFGELIEEFEKNPFETLFLIGNGVVKDGWLPLVEAIGKHHGGELNIDPIDLISYSVFSARLYSHMHKGKEPTQVLKQQIENLHGLKRAICESFKSAQASNKISLKGGNDYVKDLRVGNPIILTTNWDTLLTDRYVATNQCSVINLHGNVLEPLGIYIPTETMLEPYWDENDKHFLHLRAVHRLAVSAIEKARRIVIWGHSLSSYDAEVCTLLACCRVDVGNKREFFVVNPCKKPVERLKHIAGVKEVTYINPTA